ncbi:MAG: membrane protein insertion efficiency factor YidD [Acidobacteria bacterium]|nr:membrane protein insertion efficiency factor YidD [Acidobacteriota bacterium]
MSTLRKYLKRPETYLAALSILIALGILDSFRKPADQVTARAYIGAVHVYQAVGRPLLKGRIQCRYLPTCSDYSIEAVRKHGVRRGLMLTVNRIDSCTTAVKMGTPDPVPINP